MKQKGFFNDFVTATYFGMMKDLVNRCIKLITVSKLSRQGKRLRFHIKHHIS